jgi:LacI family transcriptional regulator
MSDLAPSDSISAVVQPPRRIGAQVGAVDSFGRRILEGIIDYAQRQAAWRFSWDRYYRPEFWTRRQLDGLIVEARETTRILQLKELELPIVVVSGIAAAGILPLVTTDETAIVRLAFDYFRQIGLKRVAYVSLERPSYHMDTRGAAFEKEAQRLYKPQHIHIFRLDEAKQTEMAQIQVLQDWIRTVPTPIGMLARRDATSYLLMEACAAAGIRVPEDVAILGVDNDPLFCELCHPSLSSIDHNAVRIGWEAAHLLHRMMAGEEVGLEPIRVPPIRVVRRGSTDAMLSDDPLVAQALTAIHTRACDGLTVPQLLAELAVSRNTLESRMREKIGRTAHQEIMRVRLDHAKMLLLDTDWSMPLIAAHCGFSYASQFSSTFRRETSLSPTRYRQKMQQRSADLPVVGPRLAPQRAPAS